MSVFTPAAYDLGVDQHGAKRPLSALPSVRARVLAFLAIVVAGVAGGLIGWAFVKLQCHGSCTTPDGLGALVGAGLAAGGVAVVAVLTLRAMGEWRTIKAERAEEAERAAADLLGQPVVADQPDLLDHPSAEPPAWPPAEPPEPGGSG